MAKIYLVDASPYIFRAFYALPDTIRSPEGKPANAVYGFCDFLIQVLQKTDPSYFAVAFDGSLNTSFRNDIYPDYKAQRNLPPAELEAQIQDCIRAAEGFGMRTFIDDRYESDDLIGTLTHRLDGDGDEIIVLSSDKDFVQLVNDRILLWDYARDVWYDRQKIIEKFGIRPEQMIDLLALQGDTVDNIPGVRGIGPKTAVELLKHFGSLEEIYSNIDSVDKIQIRGAASVKHKLREHRNEAELSYELAKIATDAPALVDKQDLVFKGASKSRLSDLFAEFGFSTIRDRVPRWCPEG